MELMKRQGRGVIVILAIFLSACTQSKPFDYDAIVSGGPKGWPIWAEMIKVDNTSLPGGVNSSGYGNSPPVGGSWIGKEAAPAPRVIEARWFSYREQKYYEVVVELPENTEAKLRDWYSEYPKPEYAHALLLGFSGKGEAQAWWFAQCSACGFDRSQDFSTPLVENVKATEVPGDPDKYRLQTQEFIDEGRIPASVLH